MTDQPTPTHPNRPAPALLLLLIFPIIGLVIALVAAATNGAASSVPPTPQAVILPTIPSPAPVTNAQRVDFDLTTLDGDRTRLSDYDGRLVFLNFWQTWCEPCKRELPTFQAYTRDTANDPTAPVILAVNVAEGEQAVRAFLDEQGVTDLRVPLDLDSAVATQYGVVQIPVTLVIDEDGIVRYNIYGEVTREDITSYIEALS